MTAGREAVRARPPRWRGPAPTTGAPARRGRAARRPCRAGWRGSPTGAGSPARARPGRARTAPHTPAPGARSAGRCSAAARRTCPSAPGSTPAISRPWPSLRWHPPDAEPAGQRVLRRQGGDRGGGRAVPVQRHRVQRPPLRRRLSRRTLCRIRLCTCSCGSPSRLVCWRNEAITHSRASSHRPPGW